MQLFKGFELQDLGVTCLGLRESDFGASAVPSKRGLQRLYRRIDADFLAFGVRFVCPSGG